LKEFLSTRQVVFTDFDVAQDKEKANEMIQKSGQMGVPVTIIDEEIVIGFNQAKIEELLAA
jgi:glutaredoxin 3